MGEARRKQAAKLNPPADSEEHRDAVNQTLQDIHRVGQRVMELRWYTAELMLDHLLIRPDEDTLLNVRAIEQFQKEIAHNTAGYLCLFCDTIFKPGNLPRVVAILRPSVEALTTVTSGGYPTVMNGICWDCAGTLVTPDDYTAIGRRIFEFYSRNLDPELRLLNINPNGGRA